MPIIKSTDLPENPDFSFIQGRGSIILESAYRFISQNPSYWDIIFNHKEYTFIYSTDKNITDLMFLINDNCPYKTDQTGSKISWIMRQLEFILINGFTKYKEFVIKGLLMSLDYK
jgi:hypothetical protein